MPADHINIQAPERNALDGESFRSFLEIERLKAELKQVRQHFDCLHSNLEAIFTRIERGETAELHYFDGRVFVISGKERS